MSKNLGLVGAGQLAMLIALTAKNYGINIMCLDPGSAPSAMKYSKILKSNYNNEEKIKELFLKNDFVSYEFENINLDILKKLIKKYPNKCPQDIFPLFMTNNRIREKMNLINNNIKTNKFHFINNPNELLYYLHLYNKVVIKTSMFGYDGKGQVIIKDINDTNKILEAQKLIQKNECIIEEFIEFDYEVSLTGVYYGEDKFYFLPLNKNVHQKGILHTAEILEDKELQKKSENIFKSFAKGIKNKSIYTIEFFVKNKDIYVNEIAPRVHNSSHHGIDNYNISQYDLFLSLFFELNLPKFKIINNKILINVLGQHYEKVRKEVSTTDKNDVIFYDYFKDEPKINRKMAHIIIDISNKKLVNKYKEWCKI